MFPYEVTGVQQREAGTRTGYQPKTTSQRADALGCPPKSEAKSAEKPSIIFAEPKPCKVAALDSAPAPAIIVLDTNVVLDALLYGNAINASLIDQLASGRLHWIASAAMRAELAQVLSRPAFDDLRPRVDDLWRRWDRWCRPTDTGPLVGDALRMRCTDPDDQIFIDLALSRGARWLLSRDRAVLKLAKRTRALGLQIMSPAGWAAQVGGSPHE